MRITINKDEEVEVTISKNEIDILECTMEREDIGILILNEITGILHSPLREIIKEKEE